MTPTSPVTLSREEPKLLAMAQNVLDGHRAEESASSSPKCRECEQLWPCHAAILAFEIKHPIEAASRAVTETPEGLAVGLDASLFPHRGSWRHSGWCSWDRAAEPDTCTCGLDYLRRSLNYDGTEPDARPTARLAHKEDHGG